jgi:hypothetical protein
MNEVIRATVTLRTPAIRATHEPRWATGHDRVLIVEGSHNAAFDQIRADLPSRKRIESPMEHVTVDVDALLPRPRTT